MVLESRNMGSQLNYLTLSVLDVIVYWGFILFCLYYYIVMHIYFLLHSSIFWCQIWTFITSFVEYWSDVIGNHFWCLCIISGAKSYRAVSTTLHESKRSCEYSLCSSKNSAWFHWTRLASSVSSSSYICSYWFIC